MALASQHNRSMKSAVPGIVEKHLLVKLAEHHYTAKGLRFGHLEVIDDDAPKKSGFRMSNGGSWWQSYPSEYRVWVSMRQRCRDPHQIVYKRYGGRGISVCERWHKFENFLADMGRRPAGTSIDRIDNNGNYEPGNCRWATPQQQARNQSRNRILSIGGIQKTCAEWVEFSGIKPSTFRMRLKAGKPAHECVFSKTARGGKIEPIPKIVIEYLRDSFGIILPD